MRAVYVVITEEVEVVFLFGCHDVCVSIVFDDAPAGGEQLPLYLLELPDVSDERETRKT